MLVLSRQIGERILIGENISVTILQIDRNRVRVGIHAPPSVCIDRDEIRGRRNANPWPESPGPAVQES